jgi:hypothetical protein
MMYAPVLAPAVVPAVPAIPPPAPCTTRQQKSEKMKRMLKLRGVMMEYLPLVVSWSPCE